MRSPKPVVDKVPLRMPRETHQALVRAAHLYQTSMNKLCVELLTEWLSQLEDRSAQTVPPAWKPLPFKTYAVVFEGQPVPGLVALRKLAHRSLWRHGKRMGLSGSGESVLCELHKNQKGTRRRDTSRTIREIPRGVRRGRVGQRVLQGR